MQLLRYVSACSVARKNILYELHIVHCSTSASVFSVSPKYVMLSLNAYYHYFIQYALSRKFKIGILNGGT